MFLLSFIVILLIAYYLLTTRPIMLGQSTLRCITYDNPSFGLATKAKGCNVTSQEGDPGVTSHAPESAKSVRE
jgi:hypothetical protein